MANAAVTQRKARGEINAYLLWGLGLVVLGALLGTWGYNNLAVEPDLYSNSTETSGVATTAVLLAWLATLAGSFCVMVGVIAKGVEIGNRA